VYADITNRKSAIPLYDTAERGNAYMKVNFSDKEIIYLYTVLQRDLEKLEELN